MKTVISCDIEPRPSMGKRKGDWDRVKFVWVQDQLCLQLTIVNILLESSISCDHCAVEFMNIFTFVLVSVRFKKAG